MLRFDGEANGGKRLPGMEVWGGLECTVNRVQDNFYDQLDRSGHLGRLHADMERIAGLGLRTLRYALHWERFAETQSWSLFDQSVTAMRRCGIEPVVGLMHHGSGPPETGLLDPEFPEKLAAYALQLASRYPSIGAYTPINEPNTTARFSGLYGHWYPHHRSMRSYVRALYHQIKGSVLAMRAIRSVRSDARFVSTEDAGKTWATPRLEQFRLERAQRRWLGMDLLCGMVDEGHPLFEFLLANGLSEHEILWFAENPCPPDVIGLNYYVTSDRFLDHRVHIYPHGLAGGDSGTEPLVDIEAVRVRPEGIAGACEVLRDAWERYGIPVAITEAHLGSTPEEQVRWLVEMWQGAQAARRGGVECTAVTVWALMGSFDWCHLVTADHGAYESGVFDLSDGSPVETELASVVRQLIRGETPRHWALAKAGWWRQPDRILFRSQEKSRSEKPVFASQA